MKFWYRLRRWTALTLAAGLALLTACAPAAQPAAPQGAVAALQGYELAAPSYPEAAPYPDETQFEKANGDFDDEGFDLVWTAWRDSRRAQTEQAAVYQGTLDGFLPAAARTLLAGGDENRVCSPLNVYLALAMLAECTGGESQSQILALLDANDLPTLRSRASALWNANYCADGATTSLLANALWLNQGVDYRRETVDRLATDYHAAVYQGQMGSADYDAALQTWINDQTGGLLAGPAATLHLPEAGVMALSSTILFRAKWSGEFSAQRTEPGTFHAPGGDETCDFLHADRQGYYYGTQFGAIHLDLENSGYMCLMLPDEGVSVDDLLADAQALGFLLGDGTQAESAYVITHLSIPKFDVSGDTDLLAALRTLGVTAVMDDGDFSPLLGGAEAALTQAQHAARVCIDEKGCTAAAYTVMVTCGAAAPPEEEVDFVLDRPFLFSICGDDGEPLFVGVVNHPLG